MLTVTGLAEKLETLNKGRGLTPLLWLVAISDIDQQAPISVSPPPNADELPNLRLSWAKCIRYESIRASDDREIAGFRQDDLVGVELMRESR